MVRRLLWLPLLLALVACDDDDHDGSPPPPIPASPTAPTAPPPRAPDIVQFRAVGDLPLVTVRTHTPNDGTQQTKTDLPYISTTIMTVDTAFLSMDAIGTGIGFLQIQILVNGNVIREAYANGFPDPRLSLSVVYRRGHPALDASSP